ncbi:MAG TPA: hypothetical protein VFK39_05995 [Gemmatimonadaceae bacterium]|nr:hypothetical protein [Gemmatimonadaceae bacterium]
MRQPAVRSSLLALTFVATMSAAYPARALRAQSSSGSGHRTPRSTILAITGGLVGGVIGIVFAKSSSSSLSGSCLGIQCLVLAGTAGGAVFGYYIGREYDRTYAQRYRGARPIDIPSVDADLEGIPVDLSVSDSSVAVAGSEGVELFSTGRNLLAQARRAGGLRGISVVALAPTSGWIALGSPSGLYLFPPGGGPGALVRGGDISSAYASNSDVFVGVNDRLEVAPFQMDTTRAWPGVALGESGAARDVELDTARSLVWVVTSRDLRSYRVEGDSLAGPVGVASLDGAGHRLALANDTIVVAMGEKGLRFFDATDAAKPRAFANWNVARFVYDVSIDDGRIFAAAGPEGVYVLTLNAGHPRAIGLARGLGFASALVSRGGRTYILDRRTNSLRRIDSDF